MYKGAGAETIVRTTYGETGYFLVTFGLNQRSPLSPHLFALIMEELTTHI